MPAETETALEPVVDSPAEFVDALSVRSLCPFCGSNQDPDVEACCLEWAAMSGETFEPELQIVTVSPTIAEPPQIPEIACVARRPNTRTRSLAMSIAASMVATLVSFGVQSRFVSARVGLDAAPIRSSRAPIPPAPKAPGIAEATAASETAVSKPESRSVALELVDPSLALVVPPAPPELVGPPVPESQPVVTDRSFDDLMKWQRLRRGMSRTAVRIMFGYPKWVDRRSTPRTEYWLYDGDQLGDGAWIAFFDGEGPVAGWRTPAAS